MTVNPRAGQPAAASDLQNIPRLVARYYSETPDVSIPEQRVSFGTSGHRGSAIHVSFNDAHIAAITQAICLFRTRQGIDGPLFLGIDTHALSEPASITALEVLAANEVETMIDSRGGYTPTPALSLAILLHNRGRSAGLADGIVVTPSHNPPEDGGFKYNPPTGGPAGSAATQWIQDRANEILAGGSRDVRRIPIARARSARTTHRVDYLESYVTEVADVVDLEVIRSADVRLGVDPLGGAGVAYWSEIADRYRLPLQVLSEVVDPTFRFMTLDWDGRIRMDCSSPYAMRPLLARQHDFDVAWACDTDHDRHGIVAGSGGLLDPNHFLVVAADYLFTHRPSWPARTGIGKTVVSSSMIDRAAARLGRPLHEVPVGFKWFVDGLTDGSLGFVGEESAGATCLRRDGSVWTTDKDGLVLGLLAAESTAATGRDPAEQYAALAASLGAPVYQRLDAPATPAEKERLGRLSAEAVTASHLAGDPIVERATTAPGNGAPIGGLKVSTRNGWFAARPSGTENVYKLYAESFIDREHLHRIQDEARAIVGRALAGET